MPIYSYQCLECENVFDHSQKISERDDHTSLRCLNCDSTASFQRLVAAPLVGYSTTIKGGYGNKVPDGFKEVLKKIHTKAPGSRMDKTSSFM
jgi:putative FmdB family regulatory protein